jgi:hypothetical protein
MPSGTQRRLRERNGKPVAKFTIEVQTVRIESYDIIAAHQEEAEEIAAEVVAEIDDYAPDSVDEVESTIIAVFPNGSPDHE